jgi:hypothetical protein
VATLYPEASRLLPDTERDILEPFAHMLRPLRATPMWRWSSRRRFRVALGKVAKAGALALAVFAFVALGFLLALLFGKIDRARSVPAEPVPNQQTAAPRGTDGLGH